MRTSKPAGTPTKGRRANPGRPASPRKRRAPRPGAPEGFAVPLDELQRRIAEAAYYIAEKEGFPAGCELEHWLRAEAAVLQQLSKRP